MRYFGEEEKAAIEHVLRPPLPWREVNTTECGLPAVGHPALTREDFIAKVTSQGKQRAALSTCMTCWDTAQRHPSWNEDPVMCIAREIHWHRRDNVRFKRELLAIAALITRHRDEFAELMKDQEEIVPLPAGRRRPPADPK